MCQIRSFLKLLLLFKNFKISVSAFFVKHSDSLYFFFLKKCIMINKLESDRYRVRKTSLGIVFKSFVT
jgi:hypothetical protein